MSAKWGTAVPITSLRALQMRKVPTAATRPPMNVVRFFATHLEKRSANSATSSSVMKHASRCTSMRFSVMLLLSVSCSQNDPENAMVFHAISSPGQDTSSWVPVGRWTRARSRIARKRLRSSFSCARWFRAASSSRRLPYPPILDWRLRCWPEEGASPSSRFPVAACANRGRKRAHVVVCVPQGG